MSEIHKKAVDIMNVVYREIMGIPEYDKRKRCWACGERINPGKGRIFRWVTSMKNGKIIKTSGTLYHKYRKDCKDKKHWTKAHKEHLKIRRLK